MIYFQDSPPSLMETDAVDSMLDSPTTSRGIDMMDLDPNIMDEPYDSGFLQSSAPIPIRFEIRLHSVCPKYFLTIFVITVDDSYNAQCNDTTKSFTSICDTCSARTVSGHEAARLSSQLAASQRQRRSREVGTTVEPRARSYDHQRQEKPEKGKCALTYRFSVSVSRFAIGCEVSVNASLISQRCRSSCYY